MAKQTAANNLLSEHPIVSKLLAEAGPDVKAYRGYAGSASRDGYVTIYPSLADLGRSFEIREADIIHVESIPEAFAPFNAIMIWVRSDADVSARAVTTSNREVAANEAAESRQGRLRMVRQAQMEVRSDTCTSNCECVSACSPCISICRWTCETRPQ
jgi:hypothetical protein